MEELLQMWRELQAAGAATAKLQEPKYVRTCGTANKLVWRMKSTGVSVRVLFLGNLYE